MPAGRPTVATPEMVAKAQAYIDNWVNTPKEAIPTVEKLALELGITRSSLYARKEFSDILEKILQVQAYELINGGLLKKLDSPLTKLMLSKHGYVEKTAQDLTSQGEKIQFTNAVPRPKSE